MNKIIEKLINKAEDIGWSVTVDKNYITFQKYSPAGHDFYFDINMADYEDENDLIQADLLIEETMRIGAECIASEPSNSRKA